MFFLLNCFKHLFSMSVCIYVFVCMSVYMYMSISLSLSLSLLRALCRWCGGRYCMEGSGCLTSASLLFPHTIRLGGKHLYHWAVLPVLVSYFKYHSTLIRFLLGLNLNLCYCKCRGNLLIFICYHFMSGNEIILYSLLIYTPVVCLLYL